MKNSIVRLKQLPKLFVVAGGLVGIILIGLQSASVQGSSTVDGTIKIDGSSTVYPITKAIAKDFSAANPTIKVDLNLSGTSGGFKKFCAGEIDITNASRPITKAEDEAVRFIG